MSLLSQVIGGVLGGAGGGSSSPLQNVLMDMLAGDRQGGTAGMGGLGAQGGGGQADLVAGFRQAGLGHVADSWVGTGPNHPVSPDQLRNVLGEDRVRDMADQAGMDQSSLLSQLAQHLPRAVDGMTPNGRLPDEGTVSV
jgi:uncharacterized protein YidB (DUF937 family)